MISEKKYAMAYMLLHPGGARMYQQSQHTRYTKRNCFREFPILLALNYYLHVYL